MFLFKRKFKKVFETVFLMLFLATSSSQAADPPNILLILVDDVGWSDFGCYGSEIRTPTIDKLAENGLRYRQFYNAARCAPSRCALLTGLYPHQVAIQPEKALPNLRRDNNLTISELLQLNGYNTYMAGKWHVGKKSKYLDPLNRGFQYAFGMGKDCDGANVKSYWDINQYGLQPQNDEIKWDDYEGQQFHQTNAIGDYSVKFLKHHYANKDKPFFLYMAFNAAHWPIHAPAEMANKYTDIADPNPQDTDYYNYEIGWDITRSERFKRQKEMGVIDDTYQLSSKGDAINPNRDIVPIPDWNLLNKERQNDLARRMALYAAMVEQVDNNIKKIIDLLDSKSQLENTFIFICSDNGANFENHVFGNSIAREYDDLAKMGQPDDESFPRVDLGGGWANVGNTPFRLFKRFVHEGGIRTPAIMHYPNGVKNNNAWINEPCHIIDIMPTILDIAKIEYPVTFQKRQLLPLEGHSLAPHLVGENIGHRQLFQEHVGNRAFFDGYYKLVTKTISFSDGSSPSNQLELYNLENDPCELINLTDSKPDKVKQMMKSWNEKAHMVGVSDQRLFD